LLLLLVLGHVTHAAPVSTLSDAISADPPCSALPFVQCLADLGCLYDAVTGACRSFPGPTTNTLAPSLPPMDRDEGANTIQGTSGNMQGSPPLLGVGGA
jgi:hypothetical protein